LTVEAGSCLLPAWLREITTSLSINSQMVLYGNVRDRFLLPVAGRLTIKTIDSCVADALAAEGYPCLVVADVVDGVRVLASTDEDRRAAEKIIGPHTSGERPGLAALRKIIQSVTEADTRCAVLVDYASRLAADPGRLGDDEHHFFAACERLSHKAEILSPDGAAPLYNPVIWIVSHERDLPTWMTAGNDAIRKIAVPLPDFGDRQVTAGQLAAILPGYADAPEQARLDLQKRFAEQTQGLTVRAMMEITRLAVRQRTPIDEIDEAVRCYRVGVYDNPWRRPHLRDRLAEATSTIAAQVHGQAEAIQHSVDILVRSVLGLSGAHNSGTASRPRGVLFFAGPTGVGKTQLAKELAKLVFGDEQAYIRFDMSEFAAEHSADRLIGAPPGYVGHDAGGELTNAVRERPFSLLLFDEIEKAHQRILDKFLQILDDGRLTDGSGSTVYFSEAILVFTSNLGVSTPGPDGRATPAVTAAMTRQELDERVKAGVKRHFVEKLNRPELFNRLGDNVVVFNYISPAAAEGIFDLLISHVTARLRKEQGVILNIGEAARKRLLDIATADPQFGGRGIGSEIETKFVNPLARELFQRGAVQGESVTVVDVLPQDGTWKVILR
jgi:ATP-dependent Clp protease ATP-binding subunit ClpB